MCNLRSIGWADLRYNPNVKFTREKVRTKNEGFTEGADRARTLCPQKDKFSLRAACPRVPSLIAAEVVGTAASELWSAHRHIAFLS